MSDNLDLKALAAKNGIKMLAQSIITQQAVQNIIAQLDYSKSELKSNFDSVISDSEKEAHRVYLEYEQMYGEQVFDTFTQYLQSNEGLQDVSQVGVLLGKYFHSFDRFFLSMTQSRRARAGQTFEQLHNTLFEQLDYPFDSQPDIDGRPDFVMPSMTHYQRNAPDCIIFTAKRTLRERWRQIVTEGTRGLGFFLATIDPKISDTQLSEMLNHRIYIVCPEHIRKENYVDVDNVISFAQFFRDYVDPAVDRWKRNGIITDD